MPQSKPAPVVDSWEDEQEPEEPSNPPAAIAAGMSRPKLDRPATSEYPDPPPPTPASPGFSSSRQLSGQGDGGSFDAFLHPSQVQSPSGPAPKSEGRPEKTIAAASRMIAAGLGVKAPKRTEEQRQYDNAMRDKERKARDELREAKRQEDEARERAKKAMWDD